MFSVRREVSGCKKALWALGHAIREQRQRDCTRPAERDRFQPPASRHHHSNHGHTTRLRASGASTSNTEVGTARSAVPAIGAPDAVPVYSGTFRNTLRSTSRYLQGHVEVHPHRAVQLYSTQLQCQEKLAFLLEKKNYGGTPMRPRPFSGAANKIDRRHFLGCSCTPAASSFPSSTLF